MSDLKTRIEIEKNIFQSPEFIFMMNTSCKDLNPEKDKETLSLFEKGLDADYLFTLADDNRLFSIMYHNLKRLGLHKDIIFTNIVEKANSYSLKSMKLLQELCTITRCFHEQGIESLLLKGPVLALLIYGNISLRPSRDLDILVSEKDFLTAYECLEQLGYRNLEKIDTKKRKEYYFSHFHNHHIEMMKDSVLVELHVRPSTYVECTLDELIDSEHTTSLCGIEMHVPVMVPYLYYLMIHGTIHGYIRLRWLMDIYELLKSEKCPDIRELEQYFIERKTHFAFLYTLRYLEKLELLCITVSEVDSKEKRLAKELLDLSMEIRLSEGNVREELITSFNRRMEVELHSRGLGGYKHFGERFHITPREFQMYDLPDSLFFLYYPLRPIGWIWRKLPFSKEIDDTRSVKELFKLMK